MNKKVLGVAVTLIAINLSYFIFDYCNIPAIIGFNMSEINWDIAALIVGNTIVIGLFLITYLLFDKRNLEKEKLADFAGVLLLLNTYRECEINLELVKPQLESISDNENGLSDRQIDYIDNKPFANNDKIFEFLGNGHILREHFEAYSTIKQTYESLVFISLKLKKIKLAKQLYDCLVEQLTEEKEKLNKYKDELK